MTASNKILAIIFGISVIGVSSTAYSISDATQSVTTPDQTMTAPDNALLHNIDGNIHGIGEVQRYLCSHPVFSQTESLDLPAAC